MPVTCLCSFMIVNQLKEKIFSANQLCTVGTTQATHSAFQFFFNVGGRQLESSYQQHQLIPSVSTGSTTTTGTSRALSFKCFSSCIPYTNCIENFIYRVVPCSNDQVVCFIKDSLVEHNHCCVCTSMRNMTSKQRKIMPGFWLGGLRFEGCFYM